LHGWFAGRWAAVCGLILIVGSTDALAWDPGSLFAPCSGDCGVAVYAGSYVEDSLGDEILLSPSPPYSWDYADDDHLIATSVSRQIARFWRYWTLEPEIGIGQRFGRQSATEVWGAFFFRYSAFPWNRYVVTTAAVSTGLNWASEVTEVEQDRAEDDEGSRLMHFFSPEITLAAPSRPNVELVLRFHHRSGVWGLVSDAWGGAQYASVGLRVRF
jgi:hypothetical protein